MSWGAVFGDHVETNILRSSIRVPATEEIFRVILDDCDYQAKTSDKGRYEAVAGQKFWGPGKGRLRSGRTSIEYAAGFQGLVQYVMAQLPQNEVIKDAIRQEEKLVPEIVIRELVANALIHQDFSMTRASVMIEIYGSRAEISNPGEPIVPVERFIDGYQSRNERLAELCRDLRFCAEQSL